MQRSDLVLEVTGNLDASGAHSTAWIDSGGINSIRVAATGSNGWVVEQSTDTVNSLGTMQTGSTDTTEVFIAARYFRLSFAQGSSWANSPFAVSVRRAS